jgi:4-hydroxy-tetrahydrodipicolinate synthase
MKNANFRGTGVAVVTPFHEDLSFDDKGFERILNHLIFGGVEYIVVLGTTGESVTLNKQEKKRLIDTAKETIEGRVPLVVGIGGNDTAEVLHYIEETDFEGIDAILSVSPYYNRPTQKGIYEHYKAIAGKCPVPIILYNVPSRTGSNISAETTLKLAHDFENIIAVKEASGNFDQCMQLVQGKPDNFLVISGDDNITLPFMSLGMDGVISVLGNAFPLEFSSMVRACLKGNYEEARKIHYELLPVMQNLFLEGNPGGIKAMMEIKGLCRNVLRLPMYPVSDVLYGKLKSLAGNPVKQLSW